MLNIGVLISGRGSNLQALIDAAQVPDYPAKIACVIANKSDAKGLDRARAANIPAFVINHKDFATKDDFEKAVTAKLEEHHVQLICLAGFMRLLSSSFVDQWRDRLINIHPSLLPAFPGLDTHRKALEAGESFAGCTVHFVRAEMDQGPIIAQASVPILSGDIEATLAERVLVVEHTLYPEVVRLIAEGRVNVFEERVFVVDAPIKPGILFSS